VTTAGAIVKVSPFWGEKVGMIATEPTRYFV
jgi:hypothetical protein